MIREAIAADPKLNKLSYEIFGQGSYANDTNVRLNSDIDINIRLNSTFFTGYQNGKSDSDYGFESSAYSFREYKTDVANALVNHFGAGNVRHRDKCVEVIGNSYRVQADIVPTFKYILFTENNSRREGSKFISDSGNVHYNYAKQHIENGKAKNLATGKRFKRLVRILKRIRYRMIADQAPVNSNITSFLIEGLLWNVPNNIYNNELTWTGRLKESIIYIYEQSQNQQPCKEWGEVSEYLYLFHAERKWSIENVHEFMEQLWQYVEF